MRLRAAVRSFASFCAARVNHLLANTNEARLGVQPRERLLLGYRGLHDARREARARDAARAALRVLRRGGGRVIQQTRGCLVEFIGDAILAVWNARSAQSTTPRTTTPTATSGMKLRPASLLPQVLRARRAAYAGRARACRWRGRTRLAAQDIRCGVHTATVFVGILGAPGRMKYGVHDGVNPRRGLEQLNKRYGTRVLVSDGARARPEREFHLRPVDYVVVSGAQRVMVHEVVARRASPADVAAAARLEGAGLGPQRRRSRQRSRRCRPRPSASSSSCASFTATRWTATSAAILRARLACCSASRRCSPVGLTVSVSTAARWARRRSNTASSALRQPR